MVKPYFKIILINILPAFLIFISKNDLFFTWLIDHNFDIVPKNIPAIQLFCFFIGIFWAVLATPIVLTYSNNSLKQKAKKYKALMTLNKDHNLKLIAKEIRDSPLPLNVRYFTPKSKIYCWLQCIWNGNYFLSVKHISGITDELQIDNLTFKVNLKNEYAEGIVGQSFLTHKLVIDDDLSTNNTYTLTNAHKIQLKSVAFCAAIPIFANNSNNKKVIGIVSIDSDEIVSLSEKQKEAFSKEFIYLASFIDKNIRNN